MKIENYSIAIHSEQSSCRSESHLFEQELFSLNLDEEIPSEDLNTIKTSDNALQFTQKLEYTMIQEFIFSLSSVTKNTDTFTLNARSIEEIQKDVIYGNFSNIFDLKSIQSKEVSLTKEIKQEQRLDVSMDGYVKTNNGDIKLDINFSFSQSFVERHQLTKTMFYDPLVFNFDGEIPSLDSNKFSFDIDCDGECDQISMLNEGSGFLALDKNENGSIDDGTELFGTQNGNGFYDLARFDDDNNGWIDENDSILEQLRIWKKTDTEDELVALGEMGIGAIFLGYSENDFKLKTSSDEILGRIRANGLFLNENGTSGVVSQIDMAKKDSKLSELIQTA